MKLIIYCVSTGKHSFVVNGNVCDYVSSSWGSRQGIQFLLIFLILVVDALSYLLTKATLVKQIHGVKASCSGPEISHLMFADDSLLFARATRQECNIIVDILNKYETTYSHKTNIEKSQISISKGVCYSKTGINIFYGYHTS